MTHEPGWPAQVRQLSAPVGQRAVPGGMGPIPWGPRPGAFPKWAPPGSPCQPGPNKWELAGVAGGGYCIEGDTDDETGHGFPTVAPSTGT